MKTRCPRPGSRFVRARHGQRGMAVVLVLVVLFLMVAFMACATLMTSNLKRELRLLEVRQIQRYGTNAVVAAPRAPARSAPVPGGVR